MHRVMGVDIETYSSVDLTEAGVYAYVEAPDFDILLISYIFDDWGEDDVKTIDCFDADPDMMAEFCEALLDPQIVNGLSHQTVDDTVGAAGAVVQRHIGQRFGFFKNNSHDLFSFLCLADGVENLLGAGDHTADPVAQGNGLLAL